MFRFVDYADTMLQKQLFCCNIRRYLLTYLLTCIALIRDRLVVAHRQASTPPARKIVLSISRLTDQAFTTKCHRDIIPT